MNPEIIAKIKSSSKSPGIYVFYQKRAPLYIGKASNLRNRLQAYTKVTDLKTQILNQEATDLKLIKLNSPIEALIEESKLIKSLKPKYNVIWRDDKQYFYVAFTKEKFPKLFVTHQPSIVKGQLSNVRRLSTAIGPFTDGASLKIVLKLLRRYFPYCTCKQTHDRECLNAQIGNCPGFCCQKRICTFYNDRCRKYISQYQKNIRAIKNILLGKNKSFLKKLRAPSEMLAVENVYEHSPHLEISKFRNIEISRIECYDISHFSGKEAVGAFTVLVKRGNEWQAEPASFRKFIIRGGEHEYENEHEYEYENEYENEYEYENGRKYDYKNRTYTKNDPRMMAEILSRRLNHPEWPYPDLIVIDGGITQYRAAKKVMEILEFSAYGLKPSLISFAKPNKQLHGLQVLPKNIQEGIIKLLKDKIIERIIRQTHKFVISYHRQKRDKMRL